MSIYRIFTQIKEYDCSFNGKDYEYFSLSSNRSEYGNDLFFLFKKGDRNPEFIVKYARTDLNSVALSNECRRIEDLSSFEPVNDLIPRIKHCGVANSRTYFVQQVVPGIGLSEKIISSGLSPLVKCLISSSVDFLVALNSYEKVHQVERLTQASQQFQKYLMASDFTEEHRERLLTAEKNIGLKSRFVHGDYWSTNILIDGRKKITGIIDFEFSNYSYVDFDIFWFIINLPMFAEKSLSGLSLSDSYKKFFFSDVCSSYYQSIVDEYFNKSNVVIDNYYDYFLLSLLYASFREYESFGKSLSMDYVCSDLLNWTLKNEKMFNLN